MLTISTALEGVQTREKINAVVELGFVADGFHDRFLELTARVPEDSAVAAEIDKLPLQLLMPEDVRTESADIRWYRGRFARRVGPNARVRLSASRKPMLTLLTSVTALAAPQVLAAESPAFAIYRQRQTELQRYQNLRFLSAHRRTSRSTR